MSIMPWVLALIGVLTPLCVGAQTPDEFGGVRTGDMVRVRTSDGQLLAGRFATSSLSSPALRVAEEWNLLRSTGWTRSGCAAPARSWELSSARL
jgi:hypothetical protein